VSIGWPLYQSRTVPELWPLLTQATRACTLIARVSPDETDTGTGRTSGIELRMALLNPLDPPGTLAMSPKPTCDPFNETIA